MALKPKITYEILSTDNLLISYSKNKLLYLAVYLLLVIISQFILNTYTITLTCGGSVPQNMGTAGLVTLVPWILIFGGMMAILMAFPGFKSAFSDVVGFYFVSNKASNILDELLVNAQVYKEIEASSEGSTQKLEALQATASLVTKLTGNMGLLINKIVPSNFIEFWKILQPLMKEQYKNNDSSDKLRNDLLNLAFARENIGEGMWFIYTGVILVSIIQYNLATRGCINSVATMKANYAKFQAQEDAKVTAAAATPQTVYTITN
jgi:hypothetical protein